MSTKHDLRHGQSTAGEPVHGDVSFETRDISVSAVVKSLIYLAIALALSLFICIYALRYAAKLSQANDMPPMPLRQSEGPTRPPEPRLQGVPGHEADPQLDLRTKLKQDNEANESAAWVDEKAGIAQIPVKDAMKIIAEKGMPAFAGVPVPKK